MKKECSNNESRKQEVDKKKCSQCKQMRKVTEFYGLSRANKTKNFKTCNYCKVHQEKQLKRMRSLKKIKNDENDKVMIDNDNVSNESITKLLDDIFTNKNVNKHLVDKYNHIKDQQHNLLVQVCRELYVK